jgi:hypothetical protein
MKSFGAVSRGVQSAAHEAAEYAKRSSSRAQSHGEKLVGARTLESVLQIQGEYLRSSYEGLVSQATKMGELATNTAKEAFAPVEGLVARTSHPRLKDASETR